MKKLIWISSSKKNLMEFPEEVIQEIGYALYLAQKGEYYNKVKPFKGYGSGVYEIAIEYNKNAYRSVYIVNLADTVYVLHCFQKKSKSGIKTPKEEIQVIEQRLKLLRHEIK
ncbi:MAG: type II toxin-antitoxin system RelE/ParE family toxin [Candidatus Rickettsiella isopodorum]|jgi:phage-related protein